MSFQDCNRKYIFILFLLLVGCAPATSLPTNNNIVNKAQAYSTSTPSIDYISTIAVAQTQGAYAQETAQVVIGIGIQATSDHEQREYEQNKMNIDATQSASYLTSQSSMWTATAAGTSIAATQTQQPIQNTQIAGVQTLQAGNMTAVKEYPTQIIAIANANNYEKTYWIEFAIRMFTLFGIGIFLIGVGYFAARYKPSITVQEVDKDIVPDDLVIPIPIQDYAQNIGTTITVKDESSPAFTSETRYIFPCTDEQLDELADKVINQGLSLAYDNFVGKGSKFTRETYAPVYSFMQANRLAKSTGIKNKGIILTDREFGLVNGWDVLLGWLEKRELPEPFTTLGPTPPPTTPPLPVDAPNLIPDTPVISRKYEEHMRDTGLGEGLLNG